MDSAPSPPPVSPAPPGVNPDHRHLYILVCGVVAGILAGPAVLGRLAPGLYAQYFIGGRQVQQELDEQQRRIAAARAALLASGATPVALTEFLSHEQPRLVALSARLEEAQAAHLGRLAGILHSLVIAMLAVMVAETLVDARHPGLRTRVFAIRYVILALWLALALAQPALLRGLTPWIAGVLVLAGLTAIFLPGRSHV